MAGTGWDYDFLNRLMKDDYYASALNRDYLKQAQSEWDRNSGDDPKPLDMDEFYGPPYRRAASEDVPDPDVGNAPKRVGPTLARPGENGPPMAPEGWGTREYVNGQYQRRAPFVEPKRNLGGWKGILGTLAGGAIAGATTPNVVAGGAVDIFRAMQGGRDERLKRDMVTYEMQRQRMQDMRQLENDEVSRRWHESQIEENRATAKKREAEYNSYENQLNRQLEQAMKDGNEAEVKVLEQKLFDFHKRGGGAPKLWEQKTEAERAAALIRTIKIMRGLPLDTPDNDERVTAPPSPGEWAFIRYTLGGGFANVPNAPQPYSTAPEGSIIVDKTTGQYKTTSGSMADRDANFYSAYRYVLGLDPNTPVTDPRLQAEPSPYNLSRINGLLGRGEKVPAPRTPPRAAQPWRNVQVDDKGRVTIFESTQPGKVNVIEAGEGGKTARPPAGAVTPKDQLAGYVKEQAFLVWEGSRKQLVEHGDITPAMAGANAENEAVYRRAKESVANANFWVHDPKFLENRGLIQAEIDRIAATLRQRTMPTRAGDDNAFMQEAQKRANALKPGGATGATGGRGPTGAAPVQQQPVTAPPPVVAPPTPPPVVQQPVPQAGVAPSLTPAQQAELDKARAQLPTGPIVSQTPAAATKPGGGKAKPIPFLRSELRAFFDGPEGRALGFKTLAEAETWLTTHGYVMK